MADQQKTEDREVIARARRHLPVPAERWLLVDVDRQRLLLLSGESVIDQFPVSTALVGLNAAENSGGTPPGLHIIAQKIGADHPAGTVFVSRRPTGQIWPSLAQPQSDPATAGPTPGADFILSRILTLAGQEDGINRGPGRDSQQRYIYIHGTNHEDRIGQPVSHGCVRLTNPDVIDLFARVEEGDPVVIV